MKKLRHLITLFFVFFIWTSANAAKMDIIQVASDNKDFSIFISLLKKADLINVLKGHGPFTIFAPSNEAFEAVPKEQLNALIANPEQLKVMLLYAIVSDNLTSDKIKEGMLPTAQGQSLHVIIKDSKIYVNDAEVIKADIKASNGVIHAISQVLMPPEQE